jgi:hypothetical protein
MFDDIPTKNINPPDNLPTEPEDMFAEVEGEATPANEAPSALDAGILHKKVPGAGSRVQTVPRDMNNVDYHVSEPVLGKIIMTIIILVIAGAVGYGAWRIYDFVQNGSSSTETKDTKNNEANTSADLGETEETTENQNEESDELTAAPAGETTASSTEITSSTEETAREEEWIDTDKDGLTDSREEELGLSAFNADTDNDDLSDGDEVLIWKTDPLNPDTDGDKYLDGEEVHNGYSPLGPGKLFGTDSTTNTASTTESTTTLTVPQEEIVI